MSAPLRHYRIQSLSSCQKEACSSNSTACLYLGDQCFVLNTMREKIKRRGNDENQKLVATWAGVHYALLKEKLGGPWDGPQRSRGMWLQILCFVSVPAGGQFKGKLCWVLTPLDSLIRARQHQHSQIHAKKKLIPCDKKRNGMSASQILFLGACCQGWKKIKR